MPGENIQDWSTTSTSNSNADTLINWAEGQPRASVNNSARAMMAAHAKDRNLHNGSIVTGGTVNAQTFFSGLNYTTVPTGLRATLKIGPALDNTGPATMAMDGLGAVAIKSMLAADLAGGELTAGTYCDFLYDGTNWILLQQRPDLNTSVTIITNTTVINQDTTVFVTDIDANYDEYEIRYAGVQSQTDGVEFWLHVSEDAGVTWKTAASSYNWLLNATVDGINVPMGTIGDSKIILNRALSSGADRSTSGRISFYKPASTTLIKLFMFDGIAIGTSQFFRISGGGTYFSTLNAINGIRLSCSSGQIKAGSFTMLGSMRTAV